MLALLVGAALALISWQLGVLDGSTDIFGGVAGSAADASSPSAFIAVGAAFIIGASMIVLPCGFPSVFTRLSTPRWGKPFRELRIEGMANTEGKPQGRTIMEAPIMNAAPTAMKALGLLALAAEPATPPNMSVLPSSTPSCQLMRARAAPTNSASTNCTF